MENKKRKLEEINLELTSQKTFNLETFDSYLKCTLSKDYFLMPVTTKCGHTFERSLIREYVLEKQRCPTCSKKLLPFDIYSLELNQNIVYMIDIFLPRYRLQKIKEMDDEEKLDKNLYEVLAEKHQKENIQKVKDLIWYNIKFLAKDGLEGCTPLNGCWDETLRILVKSVYVKRYIDEFLLDLGFNFEFEFEIINDNVIELERTIIIRNPKFIKINK